MNALSETIGGLVSTGGAGVVENGTAGSSLLTLAVNTTNRSFAVILQNGASGTLALTKSGTAKQTLTGASTYAGNTLVSQGTLALSGSGSFANSPDIAVAASATLDISAVTGGANYDGTRFAVVNGQTLHGTGTVLGALDVSAGGTIAAGNSIGTLAVNGLSLTSATSHLGLEIDLGVLAADLLNVTGNISLSGSTLDLSLFNVSPTGLPETFIFAANDLSDAVSGTFGTITGVPFQYRATVNYNYMGVDSLGRTGDGNELALMLEFVPEPATFAAPLAAMLGLLSFRRRARR
jgi:autotransporter-associated beta strand protein